MKNDDDEMKDFFGTFLKQWLAAALIWWLFIFGGIAGLVLLVLHNI